MFSSTWYLLAGVPLLALSVGTAEAYKGGDVANGGSVSGKITTGRSSSRRTLRVTKDNATCGRSKRSQELIVGSGGALKNAVVFLRRIKRGKTAHRTTLVINQKNCVYSPHVMAAYKGSAVLVKNSDPVLHNVHGTLIRRRLTVFNEGMPRQGQTFKKRLYRTGVVKVTCDAGHGWMRAYVYVFRHPYFAVTDRNGRFKLNNIPPGTYKLRVWHEKLGKKTRTITVSPNGSTTKNIRF